jgi:hypothetical protein
MFMEVFPAKKCKIVNLHCWNFVCICLPVGYCYSEKASKTTKHYRNQNNFTICVEILSHKIRSCNLTGYSF